MDSNRKPVSMEEEFFAKENAKLLVALRRKSEKEEKRALLREVVQIHDEKFLDRLLDMGIGPETAMALRLIPLVTVAWADGSLDDRERKAILHAAEKQGMAGQEITHKLLESWLRSKPSAELLALWKSYVKGIWNRFSIDEQFTMRQNLLKSAREVAEAAGGFLGLTSKVSQAEREVLDDLDKVLS